jgi:Bacterial pre-peptidase C-terminal domain
MRSSGLMVVCLGFLLAGPAGAQTSYPMITHTTPVAVQRGKTTEVVVAGQMNFSGVYKVLFQGTGIKAEVAAQPAPRALRGKGRLAGSVKLKLTVASDAALGVRDFRLASHLGVSSIGQLVIVDDPVVLEKGINNTREQANPIPVPCVVSGRIEALEDVDYFKFHAEAGQTMTFEVLCARIQDKIHDLQKHADPMLTLYDARGTELAANDDFYFADPLLSYRFTRAGDYYIQVRDSIYGGDPRWVYALFVTNKPYVSHVYPMAGNPGKTIEVEPVGSARLVKKRVSLTAPTREGLHEVRLEVNGEKTNPTAFVVSSLPQVLEREPNDTPEQANRVTIPCGINGRIQTKRDLDHYVFAAKKGKAIRFEVKARRFGTALCSSLDSVLDVMNSKGSILASNDDTFGKDAALVFTPPADGDYVLRIRDLNSKGGETAVYYIEADWARPDFSLRCDPDKAMIGPGSSTAWYVHVVRSNGFTGPVRVEVTGLPRGVTVNSLTIPAAMTQGLLVLTAGPQAPRDAANVEIVGKASIKLPGGKEEALVRSVSPNQEIYLPGGGRGRFDVGMQTVAVTDPSDILKVDVKPQAVTLKPGGEARIEVSLQRRPDYTKGVSLDVLLQHLGQVYGNPLPPGVTIALGKSKTLLGSGSKGYITLRAAPNAAPIDKVPISVLAHVSVNFVVKVSYSSPPILVTVTR